MDFTLVDPWIRIIAIIIGLASCFYGYPLFRIFLVLAGLFYGYLYGQSFYPANPMISLLVGVIVAVILAILAYPLWSIGVIAVGAALGFMILGELGLALNLFVMVATAYNGAAQVIYGLGLVHAALAIGVGRANFLAVVAIVILGSLGFAAQYAMFKDQRKYSI
jgi:hypothetical protein